MAGKQEYNKKVKEARDSLIIRLENEGEYTQQFIADMFNISRFSVIKVIRKCKP